MSLNAEDYFTNRFIKTTRDWRLAALFRRDLRLAGFGLIFTFDIDCYPILELLYYKPEDNGCTKVDHINSYIYFKYPTLADLGQAMSKDIYEYFKKIEAVEISTEKLFKDE